MIFHETSSKLLLHTRMLNPQPQKQIDDQTVKKYSAYDGLKDSQARKMYYGKSFFYFLTHQCY